MRTPVYLIRRALTNLVQTAGYPAVSALTGQAEGNRTVTREEALQAAAAWLKGMQNPDGGFSSHYSVLLGREASFPEVTGYIIPTLLDLAASGDQEALAHAERAGAWLLKIQNQEGWYAGYAEPKKPMVFDTAQIIFGLLALFDHDNDRRYLEAAERAADWIVAQQEENGSWTKYAYQGIPHTYYSRVSWALLEVWKRTEKDAYRAAARRQLDWVVSKQQPNGFFENASFHADETPVLHVISYTLEGLFQSGKILADATYVDAARKTADVLLKLNTEENVLFGFHDRDWQPRGTSRCLTGLAQASMVFFWFYEETGDISYLKAARNINRYLRTRQAVRGARQMRGALAGSDPVSGPYMRWSYPVWATKFWVDSLLLETRHREENLSLLIFPNEPPNAYVKKGEMRKEYWNPGNLFAEVHVCDASGYSYTEEDLRKLQFMAGTAKLVMHPIQSGGLRRLKRLGGVTREAVELVRDVNPDALRAYGLFIDGLLAYRASRATGTPLIVSLHTNHWWDVVDFSWRYEKQYGKMVFYYLWHRIFQGRILHHASRVIAAYQFARQYALSWGIPSERIDVVYNRVYNDILHPDASVPKNKVFTILDVGRLITVRYQEALVRAIKGLDVRLVLIGQGPDEEKLRALAKELHVISKITFIPKIDNHELRTQYNQAHVYATPNRAGGVEIPVIEAMACGLPIITSKHHSAEDAPDLNGMDDCLCVENSPEGFRGGIIRLMEDKKLYDDLARRSLALYDKISGVKMEGRERGAYLAVL